MPTIELIEAELIEIGSRLQNLVALMESSDLKTQYQRLFDHVCDSSHYATTALDYIGDESDDSDEPTQIIFNPLVPARKV
jgi:hypothetical protein